MKVDVLLGLQWGDEGKGKVVDVLTPNYDVVTRFQGGPNAGHTLEFNGEKYVLRSIPSGIFQGGKINVIGNGVVLDPLLFKQEAESLAASGHDITKQQKVPERSVRLERVSARLIRIRLAVTVFVWAIYCITSKRNMRPLKQNMKRSCVH